MGRKAVKWMVAMAAGCSLIMTGNAALAATPEENNSVAEKFFDTAWNKGDFDSVDNLLSPKVVDHSPVPGDKSGPDKFKEIVGMFRSALPDVKMSIEDMIYGGDMVVHRWKIEGTHEKPLFGVPATNKKVTLTGITMLRFEDGKIVERWTQLDELGLMQQLGAVPKPPDDGGENVSAKAAKPEAAGSGNCSLSPVANNAIAEKFFDSAWNEGDFDSVQDLLAADVVDHSPVPGKASGPEKFRQIVGMFREAMPDVKMTIDGKVYAGDKVVHRWRLNGTSKKPLMGAPATGKPIVLTGITIVRFKDGKIVERWTQLNELGLLKQLGVIPDAPPAKDATETKEAADAFERQIRKNSFVPCATYSTAPAHAGAVLPHTHGAIRESVREAFKAEAGAAPSAPDNSTSGSAGAAPAAKPPLTRELNLIGLRSIKAPVFYPRPTSQDLMKREFMTGNWGGLRDELHDKGVDLNLALFIEPFRVVSGGRKRDGHTHTVAVFAYDHYTDKAGWWEGGQFHLTTAWITGGSVQPDVGAINPIVSSDALATFRLFELWYGQKWDEGKHEVRVGKIFPYVMLGNIRSAYLFSNGSFNYPTFLGFGQSAAYFAAPFGVQYRYSPNAHWTFQAMIQDGLDDPSGGTEPQNGLSIRMNSREGFEGTLEAWYKHNQGPDDKGLPGNYKAGIQYHTGIFEDRYRNSDGRSLAMFGGSPRTERGNYALYAIAEQMLYRESDDPAKKQEGLTGFIKGSLAPQDVNLVAATVATGVNYVGLIPNRDRDIITIGATHARLGNATRRNQGVLRSIDGTTVEGDGESVLEAVYSAQIAPWWVMQFGAQHIIHPGGSSAVRNATVLGISSRFSF